MSRTTEAAAATDPNLIPKVQASAVAAAVAIYNEPANTAGHAARAQLARAVVNDPGVAARFAPAVASQGITAGSTDAAIDTAVSASWNALAGA